MDSETDQIFKEQLVKLPSSVVTFLSSTKWNEDIDTIGSLYNLEPEQLDAFEQEVMLVLAGLVHPDTFRTSLEQEVGLQGAVLSAIVTAVEQKIFAPVREDLAEFFETEIAEESKPQQVAPAEKIPNKPNVVPVNLPFAAEVEPLIPPIPPKTPAMIVPETVIVEQQSAPHPFEEKLKQAFPAAEPAQQTFTYEPNPSAISPTIEPINPKLVAIETPIAPVRHADPYREPIE